jgi:hypothetical protein
MTVVKLFHITLKDLKPDDNCMSHLDQTVRGQAHINFIIAT